MNLLHDYDECLSHSLCILGDLLGYSISLIIFLCPYLKFYLKTFSPSFQEEMKQHQLAAGTLGPLGFFLERIGRLSIVDARQRYQSHFQKRVAGRTKVTVFALVPEGD